MVEWKIYRVNKQIKADTEIETITGTKVPEGYYLEVTFIGITDITSPGKNLEVGYADVIGIHRILNATHSPQIHHHHIPGGIFLHAGEAPYGRITTAEGGDDCYFICHGKLYPVK